MFKFERFFWQFFGARLSTKLPIRRKLFNNSSCSGDLNFYAPFHCHLKFPFPCNIFLLSSSQWPRSIEQFLLLLFFLYIYIYIFPLFGYFASLSRSNTCQPRKSSRKKKCALNLKNGRRKPERATNQFYDKASPVPHFLASFRNSEFKYQIFTVMGNSSIGGAKKEYQLLLPRTPAIYCLPVQTPYTVFTFYSPFWY